MGRTSERRILIVAGEPSGDAHAARMVEALAALGPCRVRGVTGPALERAGAERVVDMRDLAVIGFSAVVRRLPRVLRALRSIGDEARRFRPDVAVLVDSPGFNFRIGPALRRRGVRVLYYIAPQVWAWHPERARAMARWVDRLAVVFPFEESLFREAGVDATFVGHPLLETLAPEVDAATLRAELGLDARARIVGLLPGSRRQEVLAHLPILLDAVGRLTAGRPDLAPVVPLAGGTAAADVERLGVGTVSPAPAGVRGWTLTRNGARALLVEGRTRSVQAAATACAVASGTATLETALFGTPLVVVYRVGALNYAIARRLIRLRHVGLPNIVASEEVAPELLQRDFTASGVARALEPWLDDPAARSAQSARLAVVRSLLGTPGASARTAALVAELIERRAP